ncbi:MAG: efflux transporter outer membrane subunit [Candidatus Krumholzibacteria bacterium]|nr:efflux transporter outer membrane subunit [Candidatus Krumholzibacteria bacterium]
MKEAGKSLFIRPASWFPVAFAALMLGGCAIAGRDYVRPETSVSDTWQSSLEGGLTAKEMSPDTLAAWWTTLDEPQLSSLIERAVKGNLDLKQARARIREARARRGAARADYLPTIEAGGSAARSRSGEEIGTGETNEMYTASFDAGWELDIFGGVRRSVEAYTADLQAAREDLRDVLVSLLAEVALNYVDVRTYQTRLTVAEANLESQKETYQLALWRHEAGLSDELAVQQARYNLESTRSQIPTLQTGLEEAMNSIAVLLGEQPGKVHGELAKREPIPVTPLSVAVGVPADVIRRRPDIRKAERQLAAQTARVGVAAADLYPKFNLSGSIGLESLTLGNLFSSGHETSSEGAVISWPIFKGGSIRKNIETQSALQEQYLIAYEAAVLGALEEVENALVAYAKEQERRQALSDATEAARRAVDLAQQEYGAGVADFSDVLDTQRSLLSFQSQLAESEGTVTSNLIRLYKALGGGWTSLAPDGGK